MLCFSLKIKLAIGVLISKQGLVGYIRITLAITLQLVSFLLQLMIVKQEDKLDLLFKHFLVEDKSMNGGASYVDFLCHMHKEIRQLLS